MQEKFCTQQPIQRKRRQNQAFSQRHSPIIFRQRLLTNRKQANQFRLESPKYEIDNKAKKDV